MKFVAKLFVSIAGIGVAAVSLAATPLVTPPELKGLLANPAVRVIDIRSAKAYDAKHIPGAVSAPYGEWRGPASNPGQLPPLPKLAALVQALGLAQETHAIVVSSGQDSTDFGSSARVYWTLKVLGLSNLSILNGGVKAWSDAALPQDQAAVKVAASTYAPQLDQHLIASRDEVATQVGNPKTRLVDARPADFFLGETRHPAAKLSGTIHNAINLENDKWFRPGTSLFVSADEAKKIAAASALGAPEETISFCNTGHWAATDWFALSEVLRQKNVKLYPGSMVDWTQASMSLPMDHVPGRGQQIMSDTKAWVGKTFR